MKRVLGVILFALVATLGFSQDYLDVVEKTDGSILKGIIIENKINDFVKIELTGGSVFVIKYSEIETLKKEKVSSSLSGGNNIVINNNSTATANANSSGSSSEDLRGYSFMELNSILSGLNLSKLNKVKLDPVLISETKYEVKSSVYNSVNKDSAGPYMFANWFLPSSGSFWQGDYGTAAATLIINLVGFAVYFGSYANYAYNVSNYEYDYYGDSYNDYDGSLDLALMVTSGVVLSVWNIVQIFKPMSYNKKYNDKLEDLLMFRK
ncbi:MAG: hypothetical protein JXR64_04410 [Spirochaetales bacterium]|nr:hypothetical protein [Spirochaetales bacterium]